LGAVSSTDVLLNIVTAAQLFHTNDGTGFVDLMIDGDRKAGPCAASTFRPGCAMEAQAQFDNPQRGRVRSRESQARTSSHF
jgi:hypothetical protein